MFAERTSVGLDVHARSVVAPAIDTVTGEVFKATAGPTTRRRHRLASASARSGRGRPTRRARPASGSLERSPRRGSAARSPRPSRLVRPAGDRVKTDAKDALLLARLLRVDEIIPVPVPAVDQEAARDLVRAREDVRGDLMRLRHRVSKLLLRHGHVYYGGPAWTAPTRRGCARSGSTSPAPEPPTKPTSKPSSSPSPAEPGSTPRSPRWPPTREFTHVVRKLCCLRGISTLTGFALAVEIGDWDRFTGASIGAYLGLVPSEHSSGQSRRQGGITKAGNSHVRRLLVEAAWHHQPRYTVGKVLQARWDQAPEAARDPRATPATSGSTSAGSSTPPAQEEAHRRHHRDRPRTRRLVLVPGHPARL